MSQFTPDFVAHIASLAKIKVTPKQAKVLAREFEQSMAVVEQLSQIDTTGVPPTYQVNNLVNVTRADEVDEENMLSQKQALANAPRSHQGYFVAERVIDHEA